MNTTETQPEESLEQTYDFLAVRLAEAKARIETANRRLKRAGITQRFTPTYAHYVAEMPVTKAMRDTDPSLPADASITVNRVTMTLTQPQISYSGWTFVATLDHTEGGILARTVPGEDLNGWRPSSRVCDHCQTQRARKDTYVVRHDDGTLKQIGKNCLPLFLGVKPSALWALTWEFDEDGEFTDDARCARLSEACMYAITTLIALGLALSDEGKSFVSRGAANASAERGGSLISTADLVGRHLWDKVKNAADAADRRDVDAAAATHLASGAVDAIVTATAALDGDGDYPTNMRTLFGGEYVEARNLALVISAIGAANRAAERATVKEERVAAPKGFLGAPKDKIKDLTVTVTMTRFIDGDYGTKTLIVMTAPDGHLVKWWATGTHDVADGATLLITTATIKDNETYQEQDYTVLTRAKYTVQGASEGQVQS